MVGWGHTLLKFFGDRKIEESEGCDRRLLTVKVEACCLVKFSSLHMFLVFHWHKGLQRPMETMRRMHCNFRVGSKIFKDSPDESE
jgi:hypothetical protein